MDFDKINYLQMIYSEKSFTKAAKKLYISQPALSKFVAKTEDELGVEIFKRGVNGLELTPSGEVFFSKMKEIIKLKNELWNEIGDIKTGKIGKLKIGVVLNRSPYIIPKLLKFLSGEYPEVKIEIYEDKSLELEEMLIRNQIDLAIMPLPLKNQSLLEKKLIYKEKLLLITPNNERYRKLLLGEIKEVLEKEKFVLLKKNQHLRLMIDTYFEKSRLTPGVVAESDSLECILNLVNEEVGISFVSDMVLKDKKWENKFLIFDVEEKFLYREYGLVFKKEKRLNLLEKCVLEHFLFKNKTE